VFPAIIYKLLRIILHVLNHYLLLPIAGI